MPIQLQRHLGHQTRRKNKQTKNPTPTVFARSKAVPLPPENGIAGGLNPKQQNFHWWISVQLRSRSPDLLSLHWKHSCLPPEVNYLQSTQIPVNLDSLYLLMEPNLLSLKICFLFHHFALLSPTPALQRQHCQFDLQQTFLSMEQSSLVVSLCHCLKTNEKLKQYKE